MGLLDIEGKKYLSNNKIFADVFNYYIYGGEEIIKSDALTELDTVGVAVPYAEGLRQPEQKYRDILKYWNVMSDDEAIYVVLGAELQGKVHYGMPVKDALYDFIGYSKQIEALRQSYKESRKQDSESELMVDKDTIKIKLSSSEFLSGFRKNDKLIPIITLVLYLGDTQWDGPLTLFDMMDIKDERIYPFINDYRINLISPMDMDDEEFDKFNTDLGFALKLIKHQKEDADKIITGTQHRKIDRDTAFFLNRAIKLGLEYAEENGGIDMCLAMEKLKEREKNSGKKEGKIEGKIEGMIEGMKFMGASDNDIVQKITETFNVTKEYVLSLLMPQKV